MCNSTFMAQQRLAAGGRRGHRTHACAPEQPQPDRGALQGATHPAFKSQRCCSQPDTVLAAARWLSNAWLQVGDGVTEFTPAPLSSRSLIAERYKVPRTLLVRFADDPIDETPLIAAALRQGRVTGERDNTATACE